MFGIPVIYFFVAVAVLSSGGGWIVRDKFCDAAAERAKSETLNRTIKSLQDQIAAQNAAADADRKALEASRIETEKLEGANRELIEQVTSRDVCFPASDAVWVRGLWGSPGRKTTTR